MGNSNFRGYLILRSHESIRGIDQSYFRNENENYSNLKNEYNIKIKITAGRTNENENYYKRKNENEKSGANHTAILRQPAVAQQCEHNLASSSWAEK